MNNKIYVHKKDWDYKIEHWADKAIVALATIGFATIMAGILFFGAILFEFAFGK